MVFHHCNRDSKTLSVNLLCPLWEGCAEKSLYGMGLIIGLFQVCVLLYKFWSSSFRSMYILLWPLDGQWWFSIPGNHSCSEIYFIWYHTSNQPSFPITFESFFNIVYIYGCMGMHTCHGLCVEIRGHPVRSGSSLHHVGCGDWTQAWQKMPL